MDPERAFFSLSPKELKIIPGIMHTPALCVWISIVVVIVKFLRIMKQNLLNTKCNANLFCEWVESIEIHSRGYISDASKYCNTFTNDGITQKHSLKLLRWRASDFVRGANTDRRDMGPWVDKSQSQVHPQWAFTPLTCFKMNGDLVKQVQGWISI